MGFFKNPLKAHKKLAKAGLGATKSAVQAGIPKQSPARGLLGGGSGGNTGVVPPQMRTGGNTPAQQMGAPSGQRKVGVRRVERPYLAEGGKVPPSYAGGKNKAKVKK